MHRDALFVLGGSLSDARNRMYFWILFTIAMVVILIVKLVRAANKKKHKDE